MHSDSHSLVNNAGFLQQVLGDLSSHHRSSTRELHLQIFPKAAGVIVDGRAGVSKRFDEVVHEQDFLLESPVVCLLRKCLYSLAIGIRNIA